uniref:Uncharacterized protein n=1 Tax=Aegilops tauschii subsp. strangulata TaxID=200361 RepID=A0A453GCB6_AEGTS
MVEGAHARKFLVLSEDDHRHRWRAPPIHPSLWAPSDQLQLACRPLLYSDSAATFQFHTELSSVPQ